MSEPVHPPNETQALRDEVKALKSQIIYLRMYLADHEERLICGGLVSRPKSAKVVKRQLGHMVDECLLYHGGPELVDDKIPKPYM